MKPPLFAYHRPTQVEEVLDLLATLPGAKLMAGGQSLLPLLNMRLAAPENLIDLGNVAGLDRLEVVERSGSPALRLGALVTHAQAERDADAAAIQPLLGIALRRVAHATVRNRGTVVGSVCHADPAAEMPAVLALLGGEVSVRSTRGERTIAAADFFVGPMESALAPDELACALTLPGLRRGEGVAFDEIARRHGDYALCGAGAVIHVDDASAVEEAKIALFSVGDTAVVLDLAGPLQRSADEAALARAADHVCAVIEPETDIHATADYRRHLAGVLVKRVLRGAFDHAVGRREGITR